MMARKAKKSDQKHLMDGFIISDATFAKKENRIYTLLLKGLIVYLASAGAIGSAVTATGTQMNFVLFNIVMIFLSLYITLAYYNKFTENVGDILYLIGIIVVGLHYTPYINSGFYSWMNDLLGSASVYFNLPDIGGYAEIISNPYVTVTFAACYIGSVLVIIVNMIVAKKMYCLDLFLDCSMVIFLPLYVEQEPNYIYISMCIVSILFSMVWFVSGTYEKTNDNNKFKITKKGLTYAYDYKAFLSCFGLCLSFLILLFGMIFLLYPKENYNLVKKKSVLKSTTDTYVQAVLTSGFMAFFNKYDNIGGMNSGRLGGVNSISLDYETDLIVTYVPYNTNPVYLRTFIGGYYMPYNNYWSLADRKMLNRNEYLYLKEYYDKGYQYSGKGLMIIQNIGGENGEYMPYYSDVSPNLMQGSTAERTYYTRLNNDMIIQSDVYKMAPSDRDYWLYVPDDNIASIDQFIEDMNIPKDATELETAAIIRQYYVDNIPYTLRPGATPRRKDFVNYFLEHKKGYCVHFASAGVLALRRLGIPARYVEGYAFDSNDVSEGTLNTDKLTEDYYEGYNDLSQTGVVSVNVTDASAHAWIEMYVDDYGWVVVELTPPSSDIETDDANIWSRLLNLFSGENNQISDDSSPTPKHIDTVRVRIALIVLFIGLVLYFLIKFMILMINDILTYRRGNINDKAIIKYHKYLSKKIRKIPELKAAINYSQQVDIIFGHMSVSERKEIVILLEKAGFSNDLLSENEFNTLIGRFK